MTEHTYPGVYIEEIASGLHTIPGVDTSIAAFIGEAEQGPLDKAIRVKNYTEFKEKYGNPLQGSWLAHAVQQFFNNGGALLYIARVSPPTNASPTEQDYQQAFNLLDKLDGISLIAVPGMGTPSLLSFAAAYCKKRGDCFFIGEMAVDDTVSDARNFVSSLTGDCSYAAVYFPWIKLNISGSSNPIMMPPAGAVAGLYARIDAHRGVWKAPAGVEAELHGVTGLSSSVSDSEQKLLNPLGVNVIREIKQQIVVWGARTLASQTGSEFRYVPVRRLAIYIEESITRGTEWVVFEPNDDRLWTEIKLHVNVFLQGLFRQGAFQGSSQRDAYFVKCDRETNTQYDIQNGILNIVVGFAPLKPAEFVVINIRHKLG